MQPFDRTVYRMPVKNIERILATSANGWNSISLAADGIKSQITLTRRGCHVPCCDDRSAGSKGAAADSRKPMTKEVVA